MCVPGETGKQFAAGVPVAAHERLAATFLPAVTVSRGGGALQLAVVTFVAYLVTQLKQNIHYVMVQSIIPVKVIYC